MKKTHIYVDASVIGGCCDPEFQEWSKGLSVEAQIKFIKEKSKDLQKKLKKGQRSTAAAGKGEVS